MKEERENPIIVFVILFVCLTLQTFLYDLFALIDVWVAYIIGGFIALSMSSYLIIALLDKKLHPLRNKWNAIIISFPLGFLLWLLIR